MFLRAAVFFILLSLTAAPLYAAPTIVVGTHELQPDTPGQTIQIYVTGGDQVAGVNFNIQIENGGPEAEDFDLIPPGTGVDGPAIAQVDLLTDTLFEHDNMGQIGGIDRSIMPQVEATGTLLNTGYVPADGLIATVTIDTTGFHGGSFNLYLSDTYNGPTDFAGTAADITDGIITIATPPEANQPPVADAGSDFSVASGVSVQLLGSGTDPDDLLLSYEWVQLSGPAVSLNNPFIPDPIFIAPAVTGDTDLRFELRVSDTELFTTDYVTVTVLAEPAGDDSDGSDTTTDPGTDPDNNTGDDDTTDGSTTEPGTGTDDPNDTTDDPTGSETGSDPAGGSEDTTSPPTTVASPAMCGAGMVQTAMLGLITLLLTGRRYSASAWNR